MLCKHRYKLVNKSTVYLFARVPRHRALPNVDSNLHRQPMESLLSLYRANATGEAAQPPVHEEDFSIATKDFLLKNGLLYE